ncbi:MAG: hypothetical protein AAF191_10420 [Verrucomicrobiota bacterium]
MMESFGLDDAGSAGSERPSARDGFPREVVDEVWLSAEPIEGNDEEVWRRDEHGNWIQKLAYGNRNSDFGWGIREARPGSLEPLHWRHLGSSAESTDDDEPDGLFTGMDELF